MQWQILDRFRNYTDPWRPLSYAVWGMCLLHCPPSRALVHVCADLTPSAPAVYATARDALLGGRGSGAARSPASFKESAFYLWFKTINHHFIEIESTRTPVPQLVPQASGLVLELGPGMGNQLRRFDKSKLTRVVGVESNAHFAPDILLEVKERGLEDVYELLTGSVDDRGALERRGIVAGSVDTVLSIQVLCSVPDPEATMRELYGLLKPGGRLIFWEHHRSSDWLTVAMQC
ncbi:hypothetical protein JDV02_000290 [Purpureocillium takamizusanense]|uniref:Methyltransferase type 11 domain-containing protein n=1 Tax=Purpureocillium takamizusanense TaxID=2060973 RepID=A0A9Q8Q6Q2_9HYPO|nr:uncharacterized protein JDV02_000290 [Purpureocillium takamizusanense]UNI13559.1 hypothetical protein JDV02_000290 [Purpureocillium takamizusanense]